MGLTVSSSPLTRDNSRFKLPFQEQIDFFNQKHPLPSAHYDDILKSAHDRAFIVAGAAKADLLNDLHGAVKQAINEGKTIDWFRGQFDSIVKKNGWTGWTGEGTEAGVAWRTRVIYQTNLSTSYAAGRWAQLNDPDLLSVRPYWKYIHSDTVSHPRLFHQSWNGVVLRHDDPWWATHFAPNGWNCFTPDTLVSGDFEIGLKSFYSGKVFKFTTRSGAYFTVTANHPILSEKGWVEAKTLNKGDNLLRYTGVVDADTPIIVNNQQPPASAKEWFESLASDAFGICKIASFDFHGDTKLRKGDVYVSGAECVLMDNFKALPLEQLEQGDFKWTDDGGIKREFVANSASIGNIAIKKTVAFTDFNQRYHGQVVIDDIVSIEESFYSGHVYTFQSKNEIIVANGIVTHNCQCRIMAVRAKEFKGKHAPKDGTYNFTDRNGVVHTIPNGIDYGFDYAPGKSIFEKQMLFQQQKLENLPYQLAKSNVNDLLSSPIFKQFFDGQLAGEFPVAVLNAADMKAIDATVPTVMLSQESLAAHLKKYPEVGLEDYLKVPTILEQGEVYKQGDQWLIYLMLGDVRYRAALKRTQDGGKNYFLTLFVNDKGKPPLDTERVR